jgi:hypothetical protein
MGENRWQRYLAHELKRDPTAVLQGLVNPMEPSASKLIQSLLLLMHVQELTHGVLQ